MPISDEELRSLYRDFRDESGEEFAKVRIEKKETIPEIVSENSLGDLDEGDVRELVRNLWAFIGWTNKDYIVDQILKDGIDNVSDHFRQALYESDNIAETFDVLYDNVNMLGPASISEILTFLYPKQCGIYNRRARDALRHLGYDVPERIDDGSQYINFLETIGELKDRIDELEADDTGSSTIQDFVDLDFFLYHVSTLDLEENEGESDDSQVDDFDHEAYKQKLLEIGDGLGFEVTEEYQAGPGARLDVRWSTRVANLGVISYAFEVHRRGSRDSALLNLMKAQNADPSLQKLVIVSTEDQIEKFQDEVDAISADTAKSLSYFEARQVKKAEEHLADLKDLLQDAGLMVDI